MHRITWFLHLITELPWNLRSFTVFATTAMIFSWPPIAGATDLELIEASALKENISKWVILDARPKAEWEKGHIPGALHFSWEDYTRTDERNTKYCTFTPPELAVALAGWGIDETTPLVVYGDADTSWGGEGYDIWLLSWLGHKGPIRLLNGGIQAWCAQHFPLSRTKERPLARKARYSPKPRSLCIVSTEELLQKKNDYCLVDVRSTLEWIRGSIPGAIHIPWEDFYTGQDRRPLSPGELKKLLASHGVDTSRPIVYYCLGGIRSAYAWTIHQLSGLPEARNYEGGWAAWENQPEK